MQNAYVGHILKNLCTHIAGTNENLMDLNLVNFSRSKTAAKNPPTKKKVSTAKYAAGVSVSHPASVILYGISIKLKELEPRMSWSWP